METFLHRPGANFHQALDSRRGDLRLLLWSRSVFVLPSVSTVAPTIWSLTAPSSSRLPRIDVGDESSVKSDPRQAVVTRLGARQRLRHLYAEAETLLEMRRVCDQSSVLPHVTPPQ